MKAILFLVCAFIARAACEGENALGRVITDDRVSQRDRDLRNAFNKQFAMEQNPSFKFPGAAVVPAVELPAGTNLITPGGSMTAKVLGGVEARPGSHPWLSDSDVKTMATNEDTAVPAQQATAGTVLAPVQPAYVAPQSETSSLLKLLGSPSFASIMSPKTMTQQDASQSLIPPLITDNMRHTLEQQQAGAGANQGTAVDPRQGNPYGSPYGGYGYQQAQPAYGAAQPALGSQLYPQIYNQLLSRIAG